MMITVRLMLFFSFLISFELLYALDPTLMARGENKNNEAFYDYNSFGVSSFFGISKPSFFRSNQSYAEGLENHFSFRTTYDIKMNDKTIETIEISWYRDDLVLDEVRIVNNKILLGLFFQQEYSLNTKLSYIQNGGVTLSYFRERTNSIDIFNNIRYPVFGYNGSPYTNTFVLNPGKTAPVVRGGELGAGFDAGIRFQPVDLFYADLTAGAGVTTQVEKIQNTQPAVMTGIYYSYYLYSDIKFFWDLKQARPWIGYRARFLEKEQSLVSDYKKSAKVHHVISAGVVFKFSLIIFG